MSRPLAEDSPDRRSEQGKRRVAAFARRPGQAPPLDSIFRASGHCVASTEVAVSSEAHIPIITTAESDGYFCPDLTDSILEPDRVAEGLNIITPSVFLFRLHVAHPHNQLASPGMENSRVWIYIDRGSDPDVGPVSAQHYHRLDKIGAVSATAHFVTMGVVVCDSGDTIFARFYNGHTSSRFVSGMGWFFFRLSDPLADLCLNVGADIWV